MPEAQPTTPTSNFSQRIPLFVVGILMIVGALSFWYWNSQAAQRAPESLSPLVSSALGQNPVDAAAKAREFLQNQNGGPYSIWASYILAQATFDAATTTEGLVKGIQLMKQNLAQAQTLQLQAIALNTIATAVFNAQNPSVYAEAFRDVPLRALLNASSSVQSMNNLINYSIQTYPTSDAYLLLARQDGDVIIAGLKAGSSKPLDKSDAAQKLREAQVQDIVSFVQKADTLSVQEQQSKQYLSPYEVAVIPGRDLLAGFALGAAARVNPDFLPKAEQRLSAAAEAATATKDAQGNAYPILEKIATNAEILHARILHAVTGIKRSADVEAHLVAFVGLIKTNPSFYNSFYVLFNQLKSAATATKGTALAGRYREYVELAAISPEFKTFLQSRGWSF